MQLGFVSAIFGELPLERVLAFAAAEGYDCVEVMCWPSGGPDRKFGGVCHIDVEGFTNNLDAVVPDWDRRLSEAVVLGAGGSARAVVYGLIERGFARIHVVNRTFDRAQALRDRFGAAVQPANWSALPHLLTRAGLLVNTTLLGMTGQPELDIDLAPLPQETVVADLVYAPLETSLLATARARGLATADGLGMLLHQAVRGFSLWFGVRPEVTAELRALVEADLVRPKE